MAISTLVLGLGGTGILALRYLKQLYGRLPEVEQVPAGFLGIDFDRSALQAADGGLAELEDDEFLYLKPEKLLEMARNMDRVIDDEPAWQRVLAWYPDRTKVQITTSDVEANGAGQFRVLGRLGFFLNDEVIESTIRNALDRLQTEVNTLVLSQQKRVILLSSVAGGTGAGTFIDIAYVCRRQDTNPRVFAYLLLPEVFQEVDHGGRLFQNAYGVLRELAHLKNQLIPFRAEYYNIPPVEIDTVGEEPFARIFLFGRAPSIGENQIYATAQQMAQTVLAQLQRTIQEKALAVVSNTVTAATASQRFWRQTHAFSCAGSRHVDLTDAEISRESLLRQVVQAIQDDEALKSAFTADLQPIMAELRRRMIPEEETEPKELETFTSDAEAMERQAEKLANAWKERIQRTAKSGRELLMDGIKARLEELQKLSSNRQGEAEQEHAGTTIDRFHDLLLVDYEDERYEKNLSLIKDLTRFPQIDGDIRDEIRTVIFATSEALGAEETLKRKALYEKLKEWSRKFWVHFPAPSSPEVRALDGRWQVIHKLQEEARPNARPGWIPEWLWRFVFEVAPNRDAQQTYQVAKCVLLMKALEDPSRHRCLEAILLARAYRTLKEMIDKELATLNERLEKIRQPFQGIRFEEGVARKAAPIPPFIRKLLERRIRKHLPDLIERVWAETQEVGGTLSERRLLELVREHVLKDPELSEARFLISTEGEEDFEDKILDQLVRCRQDVFVRRTPNPQRKGFAVVLLPEGVLWPGGQDRLKSFLRANTQQVLDCRAQVVPHDGKRIWIYFEDLFNPPEHVRNLDDYYRSYRQEEHRELFHIDRRFLAFPQFREIVSGSSRSVVTCGNLDCRENITDLPRSTRVCPGCQQPIRSRCGNQECTENTLHNSPKATARQCPACGGFNHAAWWTCDRHGKTPVEIPIEKVRCPRCIAQHLEDPIAFPAWCISRRPDLLGCLPCPHCERLEIKDPSHDTFYVRQDLMPFYRDGVNGHDRNRFTELARKYKLPDGCRCPSCRTMLIPVHHRKDPEERSPCDLVP